MVYVSYPSLFTCISVIQIFCLLLESKDFQCRFYGGKGERNNTFLPVLALPRARDLSDEFYFLFFFFTFYFPCISRKKSNKLRETFVITWIWVVCSALKDTEEPCISAILKALWSWIQNKRLYIESKTWINTTYLWYINLKNVQLPDLA